MDISRQIDALIVAKGNGNERATIAWLLGYILSVEAAAARGEYRPPSLSDQIAAKWAHLRSDSDRLDTVAAGNGALDGGNKDD